MHKLDPALTHIYYANSQSPSDRVGFMVEFTGDIQDLHAVGFESNGTTTHPIDGYHISSGSLPIGQLKELHEISHVVKMEKGWVLSRELDRSLSSIQADLVHNDVSPLKGKGVVVGIIDTEFDASLEVFRKEDHTTRVLAVWDQSRDEKNKALPSDPGEKPSYGYGLDFPGSKYFSAPDDSHATHVASIAAGDGSQAGNCRSAFTFVGVAPEAELVVVVLTGGGKLADSQHLADAMEYVFSKAGSKPAVINISQGSQLGPHDGTTLIERRASALLAKPKRAIVTSAGNEGGTYDSNRNWNLSGGHCFHASAAIPKTKSVVLELVVFANVEEYAQKERTLEIWYREETGDPTGALQLWIEPPGMKKSDALGPTGALFGPGANQDDWKGFVVQGAANQKAPHSGKHFLSLRLIPSSLTPLRVGVWKIHLKNVGNSHVNFDAWCEGAFDGKDRSPLFRTFANPYRTVSIPGTSPSVITVGAYRMKTGEQGKDRLSFASSKGDDRDPPEKIKPDLCAPGEVTAAIVPSEKVQEKATWCSDCCLDFYQVMTGTSMAAPHVTGAAALLLQKDSTLTASQIKARLKATASKPNDGMPPLLLGSLWGAGKLNVKAAVDLQFGGGGSGSGGTPPPMFFSRSPRLGFDEWLPRWSDGLPPHSRISLVPGSPYFPELHGRILRAPGAELGMALVSRHYREVKELIASRPKVAAVWHRLQGPRLVQALLGSLAGASRSVLAEIDASFQPSAMERFLAVLARFGTPRLQADVGSFGDQFSAFPRALIQQLMKDEGRLR